MRYLIAVVFILSACSKQEPLPLTIPEPIGSAPPLVYCHGQGLAWTPQGCVAR